MENKNMLFSDEKFMIARLFHGKRPLPKQDDNKFTFYQSCKFNSSDATKVPYKRLFFAYDHCDKKPPFLGNWSVVVDPFKRLVLSNVLA